MSDRVLDRAASQIVRGFAIIGGAAVLALMVNVVGDVSLRYLFRAPIPNTLSYVSFWWMVPISALGIAVAQRGGENIDVPLVFERLQPASQKHLAILGNSITILFLLFVIYFGMQGARQNMAAGEYATGAVPIWPLRFIVPLSFAVVVLQLVVDTVDWVRGDAEQPSSSDRPPDVPEGVG